MKMDMADQFIENWYALLICIIRKASAKDALILMGLMSDRKVSSKERKYFSQDEDNIIQFAANTLTAQELSEFMDRSPVTIAHRATKLGIKLRNSKDVDNG